jgi:hypothetical protein
MNRTQPVSRADKVMQGQLANGPVKPCSLDDFRDYLLYVEQNAEPLQFFLWYCDYTDRWSRLLPQQMSLSPRWCPHEVDKPGTPCVADCRHKTEASEKLAKVFSIMEDRSGEDDQIEQMAGQNGSGYSATTSSSQGSASGVGKPRDSQSDLPTCKEPHLRVFANDRLTAV